jgi:hypothetical protein
MATRGTCVAIVSAVVMLVTWPVRTWAQADVGSSREMATVGVIVIIGLLVLLGAMVKLFDLRRKRETEAAIVQAQLSDALLQNPMLFSAPLSPTARVPFWKGSPVTVEVSGQVPSDDIRLTALRVIESEARRLRSDVQIESRIGVVPTMPRRAA